MNILACDTSTETMRIFLAIGDEENPFIQFGSRLLDIDGMHSEHLVVQMQQLLADFKLTFKEMDLLVCTAGPGSFTGLRIGMSALKGISLAGNIPLVSIPTMDVLARTVGFFPGAIVPVIDARKHRFYSTVFADGKRQSPDLDCDGAEVGKLLEGSEMALVTGPDAKAFSSQITGYAGKLVVDTQRWRDVGPALVELGLLKFKEKGADDIGTGPTYVRRSDAEVALQQKIERMRHEQHNA